MTQRKLAKMNARLMMKQIIMLFLCLSFTNYQEGMTRVRTKKALHLLTYALAASSLIQPAAPVTNSSYSFLDTLVNKGILPTIGQVIYLSSLPAGWFRDLMHIHIESNFCANEDTTVPFLKTIDDPSVQAEDSEKYIPLIKKYSPIVYLHNKEPYFPTTSTVWFFGKNTAIMAMNGTMIIPAGKITNEFLDTCRDSNPPTAAERIAECGQFYYQNPSCKRYGSNPNKHLDAHQNLVTACYVVTSETKTHIYLQYIFLYGFNAPYPFGPFTGNFTDIQNAHEGDIEHINIEVDAITHVPSRIFYSAHADPEGFWIDANHPDMEYEEGHPVVFVAHGSHATYPKAGTYVRIYGVANDETNKGLRWTPQIIRLYPIGDSRYNTSTMSWVAFAGRMGDNGPLSLSGHYWFANTFIWDTGSPYEQTLSCKAIPEGLNLIEQIRASIIKHLCILSKIPYAFIPKKLKDDT